MPATVNPALINKFSGFVPAVFPNAESSIERNGSPFRMPYPLFISYAVSEIAMERRNFSESSTDGEYCLIAGFIICLYKNQRLARRKLVEIFQKGLLEV